jgi:hypothetical protein
MLVFEALLHDGTPLRALVDTGASENFISETCISRLSLTQRVVLSDQDIVIRLATGITTVGPRRIIRLKISLQGFNGVEEFYVLKMDDKYDIIIGMPWLKRHAPQIDWDNCLLKRKNDSFFGVSTPTSLETIVSDTSDSDGVDSIDNEICRGVLRQNQDVVHSSDLIDHSVNQFQMKARKSRTRRRNLQRKKRVRFAREVVICHGIEDDKRVGSVLA